MPFLCNNQYHKDLKATEKYDFPGGNQKFNFNENKKWENRYSHAYYMLKNYTYDEKPVDYLRNSLADF